jgi:hypothetical protein
MPSAYRFNYATGEIRHARRRVGSVRRAEDGVLWVGRIGQHAATARDATTAFREVAALAMGFASAAALRAANAATRARNRARRFTFAAARPAPLGFSQRPVAERLSETELIVRLQRDAEACGETPLTEAEIRAAWRLNGAV